MGNLVSTIGDEDCEFVENDEQEEKYEEDDGWGFTLGFIWEGIYLPLHSHIAHLMSDFSQDRHGWNTPRVCDTSLDGMAEMDTVSLANKHKLELQNTRQKL